MKKKKFVTHTSNDFTENPDFFKRLIDSLEDHAIFAIDVNGIIKTWNKGAQKILGYTQREIIGKNFSLFFTKEDVERGIPSQEIKNAVKKHLPINEGWRIRKGKRKFWGAGYVFPLRDKKGTIVGFTKILRDRTERKRLEDNRRQLFAIERDANASAEAMRKNLYNVFTQAPLPIAISKGPKHNYELVNEPFHTLVSKKNIIGKKAEYAIPELKKQGFFSLMNKVYKTAEPFFGNEVSFLLHNLYQKPQKRFFTFTLQPIFNQENSIEGIIFIGYDVTQQVLSRRELLKNEERLDLAQKAGAIGMFEWILDQNKIIWTPELEALYGLQSESFDGRYETWMNYIHPDDVKCTEDTFATSIKSGQPFSVEYRIMLPDGTVRWILAKGDTYVDTKGKSVRVIGVNIDINDRKNLEQQKDIFIGVASHELRTPITSLKLFSDILLKQSQLGHIDKVQESAKIIKSQTDKLMRLVDDLLDVSKIQAGKLELNLQEFDINELIEKFISESLHVTQSHQIIYKPQGVQKVYGDKERIFQVILNLVSNAIKYSPRADKVSIKTTEKDGLCTIEVQDFGIGISLDEQEKIFDRFFRTNSAKDKNISGFGLGLYISSVIIQRHNSSLSVKSVLGKGSTFYFTLPLIS